MLFLIYREREILINYQSRCQVLSKISPGKITIIRVNLIILVKNDTFCLF